LRLLRGEYIGEVSREIRVAPPELDRLLHRCHIVNIRGNSYRM